VLRNYLVVSRHQLLKAVPMMAFAENRSRHDPHVPWEMMASDLGGRRPEWWLRKAGTEAGARENVKKSGVSSDKTCQITVRQIPRGSVDS
jgi:hypothetical protein